MPFAPAWILGILCLAGVLLLLVAPVAPLLAARGVRRRMAALRETPLLTAGSELQAALERLNSSAERAASLMPRVRAAIESLRRSAAALRLPQAASAIRLAVLAVRALAHDL